MPNYHDATNEILDLQRDVHAKDFRLLRRIHIWDSNALNLPLLFCQRGSPFAQCFRFSSFFFSHWSFLRWCPGGGDAYLCNAWHCWFHWKLQLHSGVLKNGVKLFNFVLLLSFNAVQLVFCVFQCPFAALLSLEHLWKETTAHLARSFLVSM